MRWIPYASLSLLLCCFCRDVRGACPAGLPWTVIEWSGSCYQFVNHEQTWVNARSYCRNGGGKMVTVDDRRVQAWLVARIGDLGWTRNGVWIGLNDRSSEGNFAWDGYNGTETATSASFSYWSSGEPGGGVFDQDCAYMRRQYGWRWVDAECDLSFFRTYNFVCQYRNVGDYAGVTATASTIGDTSAAKAATKPVIALIDIASTKKLDGGGSTVSVAESATGSAIAPKVVAGDSQLSKAVGTAGDVAAHQGHGVRGVSNNAYVALVAGAGAGLLAAMLLIAGALLLVWQIRWRKGGSCPQRGGGGVVGVDNPLYSHGTGGRGGDGGDGARRGSGVLAA